MNKKEKITEVVFLAIDEVNKLLPEAGNIPKALSTDLIGKSAKVDSLGLVSLVLAIEQKIEKIFGTAITLVSEDVMSEEKNPFKNVGSLVNFIDSLLDGKSDE